MRNISISRFGKEIIHSSAHADCQYVRYVAPLHFAIGNLFNCALASAGNQGLDSFLLRREQKRRAAIKKKQKFFKKNALFS